MQFSSTASYGQAWYCGSAEQEARSLLPLLRTAGQTVADVLDLIRVTPEEEKLIRAFAGKYPDLKFKVERSLDYRLRVEKEFCRLSGDVRFGIRGKQFQYVEAQRREVPRETTDNDVRNMQVHNGKVSILEPGYTADNLKAARESCKQP